MTPTKYIVSVFVLFTLLLIGCAESSRPTVREPSYVGGLSGCAEFRRTVGAASQGILTNAEIRTRIQKVQDRTDSAEPAIRTASTRLLAAITKGDGPGFSEAAEDLALACKTAGYYK